MTPKYLRYLLPLGGAALLVGVVAVVLAVGGCGGGSTPVSTPATGGTKASVDPWARARTTLRTDSHVGGCRRVLAELNSGLSGNTKADPPARPTDAELKEVGDLLRLDAAERQELASAGYSSLDPNHLYECLYLRDAATALGVGTAPDERKAAAAFAFVCRQIVLNPWIADGPEGQTAMPPVPPTFALRRGWSGGLDRAFAFIALCRQLDLDAYLIGGADAYDRPAMYRPADGKSPAPKGPFWAVGVRAVANDKPGVLLFDPWRGEAVAGADGKPVTLAAVKVDPKAAAWLGDQAKPWDVTADDLKAAEVYLAVPLSAAARRMETLEAKVRGDTGVRLWTDVAELKKDAEAAGGGARVRAWNPAADPFTVTRGLWRFLPKGEGGLDPSADDPNALFTRYRQSLLPRELFAPPPGLHPEAAKLLYSMAVVEYGRTFLALDPATAGVFTAATPRELLQRGQHHEATDRLLGAKRRYDEAARFAPPRSADPPEWAAAVNRLYADLSTANLRNKADVPVAQQKIAAFWEAAKPQVAGSVARMTADAGGAEAVYLLAVGGTEQAEAAEAGQAADEWANAKDWWGQYKPLAAAQEASFPGRAAQAAALADRAAKLAGK